MAELRKKNAILCIPGLGGHRSVFRGYEDILPKYEFRYVDIMDPQKTLEEIKKIAEEEIKIIFLCNCYGAQFALRIIEEKRHTVSHLIILEPFFAEFFWWRSAARTLNFVIIQLIKIKDKLGLGRKNITYQIDYAGLTNYPLFVHPMFDIRWHKVSYYFSKINDILKFRLPQRVETKTLFIFSPKGFLRNPRKRKRLFDIFVSSEFAEINRNTHNIITRCRKEVAVIIKEWLIQNN